MNHSVVALAFRGPLVVSDAYAGASHNFRSANVLYQK